MAFELADLVRDSTSTTGTGTITLTGTSATGYQSFATATTNGEITNG